MTDSYIVATANSLKTTLRNMQYNLAQNVIGINFTRSLESLAFTKLAIAQWQHNNIRDRIANLLVRSQKINSVLSYDVEHHFSFDSYYNFWGDWWFPIERAVLNRLSVSLIPNMCKGELIEKIKVIGIQILKYLVYQYSTVWIISDEMQKRGLVSNTIGSERALRACFDGIYWTNEGTINKIKSAESILENLDLSTVEKYIFACNNCCEEKIKELYNLLPEGFLSFKYDERIQLVRYWTYKMAGTPETYFEEIQRIDDSSSSSNHFAFKWAFRYENDVAIQYFWDNFSDMYMSVNLVACAQKSLKYRRFISVNLYCFLMSQMTELQIKHLCEVRSVSCSFYYDCATGTVELIGRFLHDSRWREAALPTAKCLIQSIKLMEVEDAIRILMNWPQVAFENVNYEKLFMEIINLNDQFIKRNFRDICRKYFQVFPKDLETMRFFLRKGTADEKVKYMYRDGSISSKELLKEGKLPLVNLFMEEVLETEKNIADFKKYFLQSMGYEVCRYMVAMDMFEVLDSFLEMFCIDGEISTFKRKLAHERDVYGYSMIGGLNKFLCWCYEGNEGELAKHKSGNLVSNSGRK